jgi:RHS repeat-associated protein
VSNEFWSFQRSTCEDGETTTYGYDAASQLTSEIRPGYNAGYKFDGNGNRLSKTVNGNTEFYSYDNGDKLLSAGIKTYTYDQAGRTTSVKVGMGAPSVLTYDDEDRLKTFMGQTYTYNGFDTRVGKNGTTYHRDGTGVTAPLISDSNATYTPGISERRGGVSTFLNAGLKDVAKQTDVSGNVTATRKYDAYGMVIGSTGAWKGPFGYSGSAGYQEDETGLQLLGHRYYDSSTGRFITRDPIKDGRNWYAYCDGNPINAIDATGLWVTLVRGDGWSDAEWQQIKSDYEKIKKTKRGKELLDRDGEIIVHKGPMPRAPKGSAGGSAGGAISTYKGVIYLDPETKKAYFMTTEGPRHPTLIQILAHELGHVVTGAKDDGPDQMNNINRNENPIMKELGAPERTAYPPVDIEAWLRDIVGKFRWR